MSNKSLQFWKRLRYILVYGVLAFGGFTFALDIGSEAFLDHRQLSAPVLMDKAIQWALAGVCFGIGGLIQSERRAQRTNQDPEKP
jgi:hypothetical protein